MSCTWGSTLATDTNVEKILSQKHLSSPRVGSQYICLILSRKSEPVSKDGGANVNKHKSPKRLKFAADKLLQYRLLFWTLKKWPIPIRSAPKPHYIWVWLVYLWYTHMNDGGVTNNQFILNVEDVKHQNLTWRSENPGSYSSSPLDVGPLLSRTERLLGDSVVPFFWLTFLRNCFCCFLKASDIFCNSIASVLCTFCLTCRRSINIVFSMYHTVFTPLSNFQRHRSHFLLISILTNTKEMLACRVHPFGTRHDNP